MTATTAPTTEDRSPVRPGRATPLGRPVGLTQARITGGFWQPRQQRNGAAAIPEGLEQLERAGNLDHLRRAALVAGNPDHPGSEQTTGPIFADSDVHKWLEAAAWEYGRTGDPEVLRMQREVSALVAGAQCEDGYLNSVVTLKWPRSRRYTELHWTHEHYCAGHLIQAAVAQSRCTGDTALLDVARKLADHLVATFGDEADGKLREVDGHPVIEMALVELYRETGERSYLDLATWFVDARGHGLMLASGHDPAYYSDRVPVREQTGIEGHSVRAVYLAAGATDVAVETDDEGLLDQLRIQFAHMWSTKTYLTGGLGARWEGEAFGEPYELPADRGYAETCAAIGAIQWAWRLLVATGDAFYADAIERMLYNGFLAGVSLSGTEYFYVNALQQRTGSLADGNRALAHGRRGWFDCACCPPNVMRLISAADTMLVTSDADALTVHQYATAEIDSDGRRVRIETDYPHQGRVRITVGAGEGEWTLRVRIPGWADGASLTGPDGTAAEANPGGYAELTRSWSAGDEVVLELPLEPRVTVPHPRIDAVRGCVALERGPLVYAVEHHDQSDGVVEDLIIDPAAALTTEDRTDLLDGITVIHGTGRLRDAAAAADRVWPYGAPGSGEGGTVGASVTITAIPYYAWANRGVDAMRVWLPTS